MRYINKYRRFYCNTVRDKDMYDIDYKREVNFQWKVFISGYYEDKKILNKNTHNIHVYKWGRGVCFQWK